MNYFQSWQGFYGHWAMPFGAGVFFGFGGIIILGLVIWSIYWKGLALWKAAQRKDNVWFIVLLIVNTLGILEILYIYVFSKKNKSSEDK